MTPESLAVLLTLGSVIAAVGSLVVAILAYRNYRPTYDLKKAAAKYSQALAERDMAELTAVLRRRALEKARATDVEVALVGVQEIAALGSRDPFPEGFETLAKELVRRRSWHLRFQILDALVKVSGPLRESYPYY